MAASSRANSGIKYFVQSKLDPESRTGAGPSVGCEIQILDDERHPDASLGRDGNRILGALYDLFPPAAFKKAKPGGEWNAAFRVTVAQNKFKSITDFGEWPAGHILLQEHGDRIHFGNLKIRVSPAS